jgi:Fic family protein
MRTYEKTHPWLKFTLDLRKADYETWIVLGEIKSKCEHIANVPLMPKTAEKLHAVYLVKGVLATTAIEGNTLTEKQVMERMEGKLQLPPSKEYLGQEIDNVIEACNSIADKLFQNTSQDICVNDIKEYNKLVLRKLPLDESIIPGEIRTYSVGVGRYRAAPHEDCEYLLEKFCNWLNTGFKEPKNELKIAFGILKAIIAHLYFAWIHPFGDGNGRVARLIEFQTLINSGIPSPAAHLLSNHYNSTRMMYYMQLDKASQSTDGEFSFIKYALEGFIDGLRDQLTEIKRQQLEVTWENYINDRFKGKDSPANTRIRHLIQDLSKVDGFIATQKIREITPRVAREYASKTPRTIFRDLNKLSQMGLIEISATEGVKAKKEKILAFLPRRVSEAPTTENYE